MKSNEIRQNPDQNSMKSTSNPMKSPLKTQISIDFPRLQRPRPGPQGPRRVDPGWHVPGPREVPPWTSPSPGSLDPVFFWGGIISNNHTYRYIYIHTFILILILILNDIDRDIQIDIQIDIHIDVCNHDI